MVILTDHGLDVIALKLGETTLLVMSVTSLDQHVMIIEVVVVVVDVVGVDVVDVVVDVVGCYENDVGVSYGLIDLTLPRQMVVQYQ